MKVTSDAIFRCREFEIFEISRILHKRASRDAVISNAFAALISSVPEIKAEKNGLFHGIQPFEIDEISPSRFIIYL